MEHKPTLNRELQAVAAGSPLTLSFHAIARYIERVEPGASRHQAATAIRLVASTAKTRSKPRSWTGVPARPGSRYLYSADRPGICLVVCDSTVVTVFSRSTSKVWRQHQRRSIDAAYA